MERIKIFAELTGNPANDVAGTPETYNITTEEFKPLYNQKGVYFLYSSETAKRPIYVGRSVSNAGKTIMRHFQNWDKAKERKMTEDSPKKLRQMYVEFFPMNDADKEDIFLREAQEIDKYKPRENMIKEVRKWKENTNHYIKKTDEMREKEAEYLARQAEREAEAQADKEYISNNVKAQETIQGDAGIEISKKITE